MWVIVAMATPESCINYGGWSQPYNGSHPLSALHHGFVWPSNPLPSLGSITAAVDGRLCLHPIGCCHTGGEWPYSALAGPECWPLLWHVLVVVVLIPSPAVISYPQLSAGLLAIHFPQQINLKANSHCPVRPLSCMNATLLLFTVSPVYLHCYTHSENICTPST